MPKQVTPKNFDVSKVTDKQIRDAYERLKANWRDMQSNGLTQYALSVAHTVRPLTHSEAVAVAQRFFGLLKITTPFSTTSRLHSNPRGKVKRYSATSNKAIYDASNNYWLSGNNAIALMCEQHGSNRTECAVTCRQGFVHVASDKWFGLATQADLSGKAKPRKPSKPSKPKGKVRKGGNQGKPPKGESETPNGGNPRALTEAAQQFLANEQPSQNA